MVEKFVHGKRMQGFEQYECTIEDIVTRVYSDSSGSLRYRKLAFTTLTKLASRKILSISDARSNWDKQGGKNEN